ncbi:MAG: class A beta-lactamase-related serine hydrolase [Planctomycetota bacterium]|nr:class A beta-lactamase-related serine hydrolase [Planctomycetota bacterium]
MSFTRAALLMTVVCVLSSASFAADPSTQPYAKHILDFISRTDPALQAEVEKIDQSLRDKFAMTREQTSVGVLDLRRERLALVNPDRGDYGASVPKIGILLAYFELTPRAATELDPTVKKELGQMIKVSSNEMAAKYSRELGLKAIQAVIDQYKLYDPLRGGGIWVGKHYGKDAERYPDPVGKHAHAATVRQVMRFYLLMLQGKLVSPEASQRMREIFASPEIPHQQNKFVAGLTGRAGLKILRKSGSWENWMHDSAVVEGTDRHYIVVAMTNHPKGDAYLAAFATAVDDFMKKK